MGYCNFNPHSTPAQLNWILLREIIYPRPSIFFSQTSPFIPVYLFKMPNVLIVDDNASFASSDTFSTQASIEQPRHSLRRRNTVSQLTRRVSKRISQTILRDRVQEHSAALSEKNLRDLNDATDINPHNLCSPAGQPHEVKIYNSIHEKTEEECPVLSVGRSERDTPSSVVCYLLWKLYAVRNNKYEEEVWLINGDRVGRGAYTILTHGSDSRKQRHTCVFGFSFMS